MMKVLMINGPNLNLLGIREPDIYGSKTYQDLCFFIEAVAKDSDVTYEIRQTNHEGLIVEWIHDAYQKFDGIIINAAAYTHTSIAILDALKAVGIPSIEVHLSNLDEREEFRKISYVGKACLACFSGKGFESYKEAMLYLEGELKR